MYLLSNKMLLFGSNSQLLSVQGLVSLQSCCVVCRLTPQWQRLPVQSCAPQEAGEFCFWPFLPDCLPWKLSHVGEWTFVTGVPHVSPGEIQALVTPPPQARLLISGGSTHVSLAVGNTDPLWMRMASEHQGHF